MATLADLLIEIGLDTKEVAKGAGEVEGKLKKTWAGIGKAAAIGGAAAGAALMAGIDSVIESSKPMALLSAQLGAGSPVAAQAGKAAGEVYSKGVVGSMEEATGAVKAAVQNALVPPDASSGAIANVARQISNLSTVMEEDAGRVSSAVSQMIRTGMVKSAQEGFDLLQKGVEMGVNKSEDLLDTFNEYGTQFRKLGIDGPQAMGLLSQAIKGGARDSDTAADALKEFSIRAVDGSKASAAGFQALGLDAKKMTEIMAKGGPEAADGLNTVLHRVSEMKDPVKQAAAATALFGTKAEDLGSALFKMNLDETADGIDGLAGASKRAGDALEQSAGAKMEAFKRAAQSALVEQLAKAIPYIEATFGWLQKNSSWVTPLAIGLGILAAAVGLITVAQMAWNAALALSPITWIVLGIVALIAIIVLVATKTRFFQTIWEATWAFLKRVGAWFAGPFANFFVSAFNKVMSAFSRAKGFVFGVVNGLKSSFVGLWNSFNSVAVKISTRLGNLVSFFVKMPGRVGRALGGMFSGLWTGFKNVVNRIIGGWNNLSFTIGGGSFAGVSIPSASFGTPNIPYLAKGGIVPHTPGGRLAVVGEGGQDEAVIPLSKMPDVAGRQRENTVVVQVTPGGEQEFRRWVKKTIRVRGNLQTARA